MNKKNIRIVALCIVVAQSGLESNPLHAPWHKNGWKIAAASYALAGVCTTALGFCIYAKYRQLSKEKKDKPMVFHLRLKSKEILKITGASAPYFLISGTALLAIAALLYHKSHNSK